MVQTNIFSLQAFAGLKPKLTNREEWVLEAIEDLSPCTAEMVAEHYGVGINVISGRFTGLKNKKRIVLDHEGYNQFGNRVGYYRPAYDKEFGDSD